MPSPGRRAARSPSSSCPVPDPPPISRPPAQTRTTMSFSASPLVPDTGAGDDSWRRAAERVLEAVAQAAAQIPSAAPLELQAPVPDGAGLTLPAGTAVT